MSTHTLAAAPLALPDGRLIARVHLWQSAFLILMALAQTLSGDRVPVSEGLGMDGTRYGMVARDFHQKVFVEGIDPYLAQRILPSFLVHYGLRAFGLPTDNPHVILGFQVLNILLVGVCCVLWKLVADSLRLSVRGRWIGFIGLFVNFAFLKHVYYFPVMTDLPTFTIGMLVLWSWLEGRHWLLLAALLAASFTWPASIVGLSGAALLLWPRDAVAPPANERAVVPKLVGLGLASALTAAFLYMFLLRGITKVAAGPATPIVAQLGLLSGAIYFAHVYLSQRWLWHGVDLGYVGRALRALRWETIARALILLFLPKLVVALLPQAVEGTLDARGFGRLIIFLPNTRPYLLLVGHFAWFGPAVLLLLLHWRSFSALARRWGPGLPLFLSLALIVALTPESRQSVLAWPAFAALLARYGDEQGWQTRLVVVAGVLALALSKFWLQITTPEASSWARVHTTWLSDAMSAVQYRRWYASAGPWMTNEMYLLHLALLLAVGLVLWRLLHAGRTEVARA